MITASSTAWAATILIDFNANATAGFGWNTFNAGNGGTTQTLILDDGSASGVSIALPSFFDSANPGWNPANALPAWAPNSVADDYSFFNNTSDGGTQLAQFVFSGLSATEIYTIDFMSSRNLDRLQDVTVTHGGGVIVTNNWSSQADGWVAGNVMTFGGLTADGLSQIVLDVNRQGISANFNAFRITSVPIPVPEPNIVMLTALGLIFLASERPLPSRRLDSFEKTTNPRS